LLLQKQMLIGAGCTSEKCPFPDFDTPKRKARFSPAEALEMLPSQLQDLIGRSMSLQARLRQGGGSFCFCAAATFLCLVPFAISAIRPTLTPNQTAMS
jgi:hypothetical protein